MIFPERPLGYVKEGLEELGHTISHVYEDLVFPSHTAYLIQFGNKSHELLLFMNRDCEEEEREILKEELIAHFAGRIGFSMEFSGLFSIEQKDEENLNLSFFS